MIDMRQEPTVPLSGLLDGLSQSQRMSIEERSAGAFLLGKARLNARLTREDAALKLGIAPEQLRRYECGADGLGEEELCVFLNKLDVFTQAEARA
jgi:hypothetical protein